MKYSFYVFILTVVLLISCEDEIVYSNPANVAEHFNESIKKGDTTLYKKVFNFSSKETLPKELKKTFLEASKLYKTKKIELIRVDTTFSVVSGDSMKSLSLVFKDAKKDLYISELVYNKNYEYLPSIEIFSNISEECENHLLTDYIPNYIRFHGFNKRVRGSSPTYSFINPGIKISNLSDYEVSYLKFICTIKDKKGHVVFSDTFIHTNKNGISTSYMSGDDFKLHSLNNFYAGFDVSKEGSNTYEFKVMEAKPKPESYHCKALEYYKENSL